MTIYHDFVQQANRILEKEEAKADAVGMCLLPVRQTPMRNQ